MLQRRQTQLKWNSLVVFASFSKIVDIYVNKSYSVSIDKNCDSNVKKIMLSSLSVTYFMFT